MDNEQFKQLTLLQQFFVRLIAMEESRRKSEYSHGYRLEFMRRDRFLQREKEKGETQ